jgi:hypothetical protein
VIIGERDFDIGKKIEMYAVYFYYQLIEEGSFSPRQTSYWLLEDFTCWELLDFEVVEPKGVSFGIDSNFIKEAAIIYIVCMLDNYYFELEEHEWPTADDETINVLNTYGKKVIPELHDLIQCVLPQSGKINFERYNAVQKLIYDKYVYGRFISLLGIGNLTKS